MGLSLTGRKRKDTYTWLLQMQGAGSTLHASVPIVMCFGDGTATPLSLTTTGLFIGGSAALVASQLGTVEGKIPVLGAGDKLAASMIPAVNVIDSLSVANAAARLALSSADALNTIVLDADTGKTWALVSGGTPATSGDWLQIGDRAIATSDVAGLEDALDLKADLNSPELTTPNLIGGNISGHITIQTDGAYNLGDGTHYLAAASINTVYAGALSVGYGSSGSMAGNIFLYADTGGSHTQLQSLATTGRLIQFPDKSGVVATMGDLSDAVAGLLDFKGNIDCSGNPDYPTALKGDTYYVSVAGKIGGGSGLTVDIGDAVICKMDAATGNEATVGTSWFILEKNLVGVLLSGGGLGTPSSGNLVNCAGLTVAGGGTGATTIAGAHLALGLNGVKVVYKDGSFTCHPFAADSDEERGLAFVAAHDAAVAAGGHYTQIICPPGKYKMAKKYSGTLVGGFPTQYGIYNHMLIYAAGCHFYKVFPEVAHNALVVGEYYTIGANGSTANWIYAGAANNNGGTQFQATQTAVDTGAGFVIPTPTVMFNPIFTSGALGTNDWAIIGPAIIEGTATATAGTGYTGEIGINVSASRRWRINSISCIKHRGTGMQANNANFTGDATGYGGSAAKVSTGHVTDCNFDFNNIGIGAYAGNEFISWVGCSYNFNLTGVDMYAGNHRFLSCEANFNTNYGLRIRRVAAANDGHSSWSGGIIAHNLNFAVMMEAGAGTGGSGVGDIVNYGFQITGTTLGGGGSTTNKVSSLGGGLNFGGGCYFDAPLYASATPTGINTISNCFFPKQDCPTYALLAADLSTAERAKWKLSNNYTLTGRYEGDDAEVARMTNISAARTLGTPDDFINITSGTFDVTLPSAKGGVSYATVTGVASTNIITVTSNALSIGMPVVFTSITGGAGLVVDKVYWVINLTGQTFKLAADQSSTTAIDFTTDISAATLVTANNFGMQFTIKNSGSGTIGIATTGGELTDGAASGSISLAQWAKVTLVSDGIGWITR